MTSLPSPPADSGANGPEEAREYMADQSAVLSIGISGIFSSDVPGFKFLVRPGAQLCEEGRDEGPPAIQRAHCWTPDEVIRELQNTPALVESGLTNFRQIGAGGMGFVFEAYNWRLVRYEAVKVLIQKAKPDLGGHAFTQEGQVLARLTELSHPNLLPVFHAGMSAQGVRYLVMARVAPTASVDNSVNADSAPANLGTATRRYFTSVDDPGFVRWNEQNQLIRFYLEILDAVKCVHTAGVIHADLKPSNVLIGPENHLYVADLGLSIWSNSDAYGVGSNGATSSKGFRGTIRYAAPEQLRSLGDSITTQTDVYQLGLILWGLLTNRVPFQDSGRDSPGEIAAQIISGHDPFTIYGDPCAINPSIPRELRAIIHKALQPDPTRRYRDAGHFKEDFEAFLNGREVEAYSSQLSAPQRVLYHARIGVRQTATWVRRNLGVTAGLAAAALGLGGIGLKVVRERDAAAQARINEIEQESERLLAAARIEKARELAQRLLNDARYREDTGDIVAGVRAAVSAVPQELLRQLEGPAEQDVTLRRLVDTLKREDQDRRKLVEMVDLATAGYATAVSGTVPGTLGKFEAERLLDARNCLLPGGLTPESIAHFKQQMSNAHFSERQRSLIATIVAEVSLTAMVSQNEMVPWDVRLPVDVRRGLAAECALIAQACEACGVKIAMGTGGFAVPNTVPTTQRMIQRTYEPNTPVPMLPNGYHLADISVPLLYETVRANDVRGAEPPLKAAERAKLANPKSFLVSILGANVHLQASTNNDPVLRYRHTHNALDSLLTAHEIARESRIDHHNLSLQVCELIRQVARAALSVPQDLRPELLGTVLRAGSFIDSNESLMATPQAQSAKAMLDLIQGVGVADKDISLLSHPTYKYDATLIQALSAAYRGEPSNKEDADWLLSRGLPKQAPIIAAIIYTNLGEHEKAITLLEGLGPEWLPDIRRMCTTHLERLSESPYANRFRQLTAPRNSQGH
jgi:serine/threonine protein kinase